MSIMLSFLLACQVDALEKSELKQVFENQWWKTDQEVVEDFYETESNICFMFYSDTLYEGSADGMVYTYFLELDKGDQLTEYVVIDDAYQFVEYGGIQMQVASTPEGYEGIFSQGLFRKRVDIYACDIFED